MPKILFFFGANHHRNVMVNFGILFMHLLYEKKITLVIT